MAGLLVGNGHDAVHTSDLGLETAPDQQVLGQARESGRVLVSAESDFGTILGTARIRRLPLL